VASNAGYINVASLLLTDEKTSSIRAAIQKIKEANPKWIPKMVMTDFSECQIMAVEAVFPGLPI